MRPLALAVLALLITGCTGEEKPAAPSPAERDVRRLAGALQAQHPDLFHDLDREEFRGAVEELADDASGLSRDELVVGLMRLAALPGERDGHTAVYPFDRHPRPLHVFPIRLYHLAGGLHALAALGAEEVVGRRLNAIGGRPVDEVVELVRPLVPHDNESSLRWLLPEYVTTAEVLRGLGVAGDGPVEFAFEGGVEAELEAEPADAVAASVGSALAPPPTSGDPVWLRNLDDSQWLTTLEDGRVVYLGYRITTDATDDVAARLAELASPASVRRVIVDVRLNHGGNNQTYGALLDVLARTAISRKLVLLTGRQTFSAAGNFVADVARGTKARIVGERAGGEPSQWGDSVPVDLPHTGLLAHVATIYQDYGPADVEPDVHVEPTAADLLAGRDPVLARALALP
jgi:hypothetical protein